MFGWLRRSKIRAAHITNADVMSSLLELRRVHDLLQEELEALKARQQRFEGRVSAWHKKDLSDAAATGSSGAGGETKEQLRARLLPHGKRFKHDTN